MVGKMSLPVFLLVGILFFLPWFSATSGGVPVAEISGLQLITGYDVTVPGAQGEPAVFQKIQPNPLAISIVGIILLGCLAFFIRGKLSSIISLMLGFFGAALLMVLQFNLEGHLSAPGAVAEINYLPVFWFVLAAFVLAAVISVIDLLLPGKSAIDERYLPKRGFKSQDLDIESALLYRDVDEDIPPPVETFQRPIIAVPPAEASQACRFCHKCGAKAMESMGFCHKCGVKLLEVE